MTEKVKIVIIGGGTAGWMFAAALAGVATDKVCELVLVESDEIATVGVGEATLPSMKDFNDYIGLIEQDMMQKTNATFKLGIEFVDWGFKGSSYIHPFGAFGEKIAGVDFHQCWVRVQRELKVEPIEAYSYAVQACRNQRFDFPVSDSNAINSTYAYAYHFDAGLYASYLRRFSEKKGAKRVEGKVIEVVCDNDTGFLQQVKLESGQSIEGDYFIDCSGFRSLLMGQKLGVEFERWDQWLPCDRALAVPSEKSDFFPPYTRSLAQKAGWQWRIPLQNRTGNGYVYGSDFISEDEATASLLAGLDGKPLADPRPIKFTTGRRKFSWYKNCVAVGLASGFLEPLESTSIYLIQAAIVNFIKLFPGKQFEEKLMTEFNRLIDIEYERVRDFLILHYHLNERDDSELWRYCRSMTVPDSLNEKMELFERRGYIDQYRFGLFAPPSWLSVFMGQGLVPEGVEPLAQVLDIHRVNEKFKDLSNKIAQRVAIAPTHAEFINDYCPSAVL